MFLLLTICFEKIFDAQCVVEYPTCFENIFDAQCVVDYPTCFEKILVLF